VTVPGAYSRGFFPSSLPVFSRVRVAIYTSTSPRFCVFYICMNTFNTAVKNFLPVLGNQGHNFVWTRKILLLGIWPSSACEYLFPLGQIPIIYSRIYT
jgi:hypothetical protein